MQRLRMYNGVLLVLALVAGPVLGCCCTGFGNGGFHNDGGSAVVLTDSSSHECCKKENDHRPMEEGKIPTPPEPRSDQPCSNCPYCDGVAAVEFGCAVEVVAPPSHIAPATPIPLVLIEIESAIPTGKRPAPCHLSGFHGDSLRALACLLLI